MGSQFEPFAQLSLPAIQEEALNTEHRPAAEDEASDYLVIVELASRNTNTILGQHVAQFAHLIGARPNCLIKRIVCPQEQARDGPGFDADIYCVCDLNLGPDRQA